MGNKAAAAAVLLMIAGLLYRGETSDTSSAATAAQPAAQPPARTQGDASAESGPWTPVCRYVKLTSGSPEDNDQDPKKQFCLASPNPPGWHVTTLIATVPNPELTHLSLSFDRYVESITWALDDGDLDKETYSFDSYWFPWRTDQKEETDPEKRGSAEREREKRSEMPGILLFRRSPQRPDKDRPHPERDLLMVFLVGETPTGGINRIAFDRAWNYATKLRDTDLPICKNARGKGKTCIAILGPSFTGSLPSLKLLLDDKQKAPGYETFVISGAVTGEDPGTSALPDTTHFCTTIETDHNRWQVFNQIMQDLSASDVPERFALLGEDETEYGNLQKVAADGRNLLTLRFPRGIARIRNSSEQIPGGATPARSNAYPEVPLILRDTGQDTIPSFSTQQSPVSQWAVLVELVATLRREGIRYVGIVATDSLDALFLARAIHTFAPNIRIVLFSADLLFARASHTWGLSGVLALTSYPLISRNQYYAGSVRPRRAQFASDAAEGEYNACRRMLLVAPEPDATQPCSAKNQPQDGKDYLLDYAPPFAGLKHSHKPSVWLTILGRNEWWPVAAAAVNESRLLEGPPPASHSSEEFSVETSPRPWFLFFWLILLACALHVLLFFAMNNHYPRLQSLKSYVWRTNFLRWLAWEYNQDLGPLRRPVLAGAALTVAFACCALTVVIWAAGLKGWGYLQLGAALVVGIAATLEVLWAIWGMPHRLRWIGVTGLAVASVIAGTGHAALSASTSHTGEFAGYRALHIESGTSPLLPVLILLLTIYLFCCLRLSHLRVREERHVIPPAGDQMKAFPYFSIPERAVPTFGNGQWILVGAGVLGWWIFFKPLTALASVEGSFYDWVLFGLTSVIIAMYTRVLVRFYVSWHVLRKHLLQKLERHPLRYAFTRLPKTFSWTTVWAGDPRPQLVLLYRSADVLSMLPDVKSQTLVSRIHAEFEKQKMPEHLAHDPDVVARLNQSLNEAFALLSSKLQRVWSKGVSDTVTSREKKEEVPLEWGKHPRRLAAEEYLALRFLTVIAYTLKLMRGLLAFITYGFILLVVALTVYPFEGKRHIEAAIVCIFLVAGTTVGLVFAQMDRDPLMSRLSESSPNRLGINFVYRMLSYGALPLLTLLASLVPDIGNFLQSWLQPALQSLK